MIVWKAKKKTLVFVTLSGTKDLELLQRKIFRSAQNDNHTSLWLNNYEIVEQTGAKHPHSSTLFGKRHFSWKRNDHKDSCTSSSFLSLRKTGITLAFYLLRQKFYQPML